jgi:hypothetical protein
MKKPDVMYYPQGCLARFRYDVFKYEKYLNLKRKRKKIITRKSIDWLKYGLITIQ